MIRLIRRRLQIRQLRSSTTCQSSSRISVSASEPTNEEDVTSIPYGNSYGSGPSRLPFIPLAKDTAVQRNPRVGHNNFKSLDRRKAWRLKRLLQGTSHSSTASDDSFHAALEKEGYRIKGLSRLELHIILHHLARSKVIIGRAPFLISAFFAAVVGSTTYPRKRRRIRHRTIHALLRTLALPSLADATPAVTCSEADIHVLDSPLRQDNIPLLSLSSQHKHPIFDGSLREPPLPSDRLLGAFSILESLQSTRNRRTSDMYMRVINQCLEERRPDLGAKIYVGLVEEWITEGRIAHGAQPDHFEEGGLPPEDEEYRAAKELDFELLKIWWKGVRSWTLPGEVLSPHQRLSLWHPRKLSLAEKLRTFPFPLPASPPRLVPAPDVQMLDLILDSLKLVSDPDSPADFTASMRACAFLSSTILSRTIPVALDNLISTLKATPRFPAVYPEGMAEVPPEDDRWAYQAFTHIHLALQSLLWAPPKARLPGDYVAAIRGPHADFKRGAYTTGEAYMLYRLGWVPCMFLVRYALGQLKQPILLSRLLQYIKENYDMGLKPMRLYNQLYRWGDLLRSSSMLRQIESIVFGLKELSSASDTERIGARAIGVSKMHPPEHTGEVDVRSRRSRSSAMDPGHGLVIPYPEKIAQVDERTLQSLILHLAGSGQGGALVGLVHTLIPFLQYSKSMTDSEVQQRSAMLSHEPGFFGRPKPNEMSPQLYTDILVGLRRVRRTMLAQRVFALAQQSERLAISRWQEQHPDEPIPEKQLLDRFAYTQMILLWGKRLAAARSEVELRGGGRRPISAIARDDWCMPDIPERLGPMQIGTLMVWKLYREARNRWLGRMDENGGDAGKLGPNAVFFDAIIKANWDRWRMSSADVVIPDSRRKEEVLLVLRDMVQWEVPTLRRMWRKVGREAPNGLRFHEEHEDVDETSFGMLRPGAKSRSTSFDIRPAYWPQPDASDLRPYAQEPSAMVRPLNVEQRLAMILANTMRREMQDEEELTLIGKQAGRRASTGGQSSLNAVKEENIAS